MILDWDVLQWLNAIMMVVLVVWAFETYVLQARRYRDLLQDFDGLGGPELAAATERFGDSELARVMSYGAMACLAAYLILVIYFRVDVDFALALVLATGLTGVFWLLDLLLLKRLRLRARQHMVQSLKERGIEQQLPELPPRLIEYSESFFPVLAAVLVVRSFLVEPFTIPSGSMLPTLEVGDYILVNKFAYGLRVPVLGTRFVNIGEPQRGDIMVFRYPKNPTENFIKRLVGLPGDHIRVDGYKVYVNNQLVQTTLDHQDPEVDPWQLYFKEQLGAHLHITRQLVGLDTNRPDMSFTDVVVPAGHYFMMGDNRNESDDSRYWGFVPDENIVGKAFCIWIHKQPGLSNLPTFERDGIVN